MYRLPAAMGLAILAAFVVGGATAIYGFDYFERAWGRFNTLQVHVWIGLPAGAIAGIGAYLASAAIHATDGPRWGGSLAYALVFASLLTVLFFAMGDAIEPFGLLGMAVAIGATAFVYAILIYWRYGKAAIAT